MPPHLFCAEVLWTRPAGNLRADPEDCGGTKYPIWPGGSIGGAGGHHEEDYTSHTYSLAAAAA